MDDVARPVPMSPVEVARGWLTGTVAAPVPGPVDDRPVGARAAFEAAVRTALARPPCFVGFSGGRDSSAILAVAAHVARRDGLPLPVPVTLVYPGMPEADESAWQELVLAHLALRDWVRIEVAEELDLLGPVATARLREHGVLWNCLLHTDAPVLEVARGGTVLDGEAGDEMLGPLPHRLSNVVAALGAARRRRPPRPSGEELRAVAEALAPRRSASARRWVARSRVRGVHHTWLRPDARAAFVDDLATDAALEPLRVDRSLGLVTRRRMLVTALAHRRWFARRADVDLQVPFLDAGFVGALGRAAGWRGLRSRTAAMRMLFADVLPDVVCARDHKGSFGDALTRGPTRAFVAGWDGRGVDPDLVDPEALRDIWTHHMPHALTGALLQQAWLASEG